MTFSKHPTGPRLNPETIRRVDILFPEVTRERAKELLAQLTYKETERIQFAALKYSDGRLDYLDNAVKLGNLDFRDLLMAAGFGEVDAHLRWQPKPANEPSEVDPVRLAELTQRSLAKTLAPIHFTRDGNLWSRDAEVRQTLALEPGLGNRVQARFFLKLTLHSQPLPFIMMLPKLSPNLMTAGEQGYIFCAGDCEDAIVTKVNSDLTEIVVPFLERFTNDSAIQSGIADGSFKKRIQLQEQILLL